MVLILIVASLLCYLAAGFVFLADIVKPGHGRGSLSRGAVWAAAAVNAVAVVWEAAEAGPGSLLAMPNGLMVVALTLVAGYLILQRLYAIEQVGALVAPLAALLLTVVLFGGFEVTVSEPVRGGILPVHIGLAFVGTAAFALAFIASVLHSIQAYQLKHKRFGVLFRALPPLDELDSVNARCVSIGFPVYSAAILLGIIWSSRADAGGAPYSGVAMATLSWLLYGVVFQARLTAGWRGNRAAAITVVGFLSAAGVLVAYLVR